MSKRIIEKALVNALKNYTIPRSNYGLFENVLKNGKAKQRENEITNGIEANIRLSKSQVRCNYNNNSYINVDLVKYQNTILSSLQKNQNINNIVDWALEVKHFSPHNKKHLNRDNPRGVLGYLELSLGGPIDDLLKLTDFGFQKFYILQLQTQVSSYKLHGTNKYIDIPPMYSFFKPYLSLTSEKAAKKKISIVSNQNRIDELVKYSRLVLDKHLIYDNVQTVILNPIVDVDLTIHYLISGPFNETDIKNRMPNNINTLRSLRDQVGAGGVIPSWDINVQIESDPED